MIRHILIAAALLLAAPHAAAAEVKCSVDITANDAMQFDRDSIEISRSCKQFTINLKHTGKLARNVMGHNVVIVQSADMEAVNAEGMQAGLENDYVKPGDQRVLAHTRIIGGGESDSMTFDASTLAADGSYSFFCSFPGHSVSMKGTVQVVP